MTNQEYDENHSDTPDQRDRRKHGTKSCYVHDRCRCQICLDAWNAYNRALYAQRRTARSRRYAAKTKLVKHGLRATYQHLGCRCDLCRAATTAYRRELRAKKRESEL